MGIIKIIGGAGCAACKTAVKLCEDQGVVYNYQDMAEPSAFTLLQEKGLRSIPQVWVEDAHIGGLSDLKAYLGA